MIYLLLLVLLTSCCAMGTPTQPRYTHDKSQVALNVQSVRVVINDPSNTAEQSGLSSAFRSWERKRFRTIGSSGTLLVTVSTKESPDVECGQNALILQKRRVTVSVRVMESEIYEDVNLAIETSRTNNDLPSHQPSKGSAAWAEYMTNLVNSIDTQIIHGLRRYAPKLFPHNHWG